MTKSNQKIFAMIPARMGSTRLAKKNLALLNGKPLISYAIDSAKESGVFEKIIINSENQVFQSIAGRYGIDFYHRPTEHATSEAKSDEVVYDFMQNNPCDIVVWVNPIAPLQSPEEIRNIVNYFMENDFDTLITVKDEQVHCLFDGKPLNFNEEESFAQTQALKPVQPFVYSLMMWKTDSFVKYYKKNGHAILCGKIGYHSVSKLSSIIVKREEDLRMAEYFLAGKDLRKDYVLAYDGETNEA